jgi:glycosyltransferase involved in cell wall biosynthesis
MKFLVYCPLNRDNIATSLGTADYSYYFVMQRFLPLLQEFGEVEVLPEPPVDEAVSAPRDKVVYLAFTPPDKAVGPRAYPVVPVFAWEYSTIPCEAFRNPADNWVADLQATGRAITHSSYAAEVVREQLGQDYDIACIPAPLWDDCAQLRAQRRQTPPRGLEGLELACKVIDSHSYDISNTAVRPKTGSEGEQARLLAQPWDGEPLAYSFARGEQCPTLVGFNDAEPWGVWSRSGYPWLMLDAAISGDVEIEISLRGYAHNIDQPLGIELGDCTAHLLLTDSLATHTLQMHVAVPATFLAFNGVEKRAVGMDDPRDIGFGLAALKIRRLHAPPPLKSPLLLDFAADELALEGFNPPEAAGCWTAASRCTVHLPRAIAGDITLRLELFHLLHNHGREIELWLGGSRTTLTLDKDTAVYELKLPAIGPTRFLRFDGLGHGSSGEETDAREFGLGIARISLAVEEDRQDQGAPAEVQARAAQPPAPRRPARDETLYTAILNPNDGRKNWEDIITAFVYALRDRPGATLLVKIANEDLDMFFEDIFTFYMRLHPFACRLVFIHGYLTDEQYRQLILHSHYIVNASRGEGQCLPLMEFMSAGVPAIAPRNTAMLDYIDSANAFLVESSPELAYWPHDPRQVFRTYWHRINWQTLYQAFVDSEALCRQSPRRYRRMGEAAIAAQQRFCSMEVARARFGEFLARLQRGGEG